jgi:hypothetical protein
MKPESSLPCSQEPATSPSSEPMFAREAKPAQTLKSNGHVMYVRIITV